jgi:TPR repeat protein
VVVSRLIPLFIFATSLAIAVAALAETKAEKPARIQAAIEACDKGAAAPLDPEATAPPVQFPEFFVPFDPGRLSKLAADCKTAMEGAPDQKRLKLQYIRSAIATGDGAPSRFVPDVRAMAAAGSAEANSLLYVLYGGRGSDPQIDISREEAVAGLIAAADAGMQAAVEAVIEQYRFGPNVVRDPRTVAHYAERLMDIPQQGVNFKGATEDEARARGRPLLGGTLIIGDGFTDDERVKGFAIVKELYEGGDHDLLVPYVTAFRYGRGTAQDAEKARQLAETAVADNNARMVAILADMLANGEGGPVDGKRALTLLTSELGRESAYSNPVLAGLYLDNRFTGPRPRDAAMLLATAPDIDSIVKAAPLFADYDVRLKYPLSYELRLSDAAEVGEPGAAWALVRLKFSNHPDYGNDDNGARAILTGLAAGGDREAALVLAETQYGDLGTSSFNPVPKTGAMSDTEVRDLIEGAIADDVASAYRVKARLQRVGVVYPQDDAAATQSLIEAANRGDIEAMLLLGDAYDDGLGVAENHRERLHAWREAAKRGSLAAREKIANAFTFDTFDKLITLREGVTERVALHNNSGSAGGFGGIGAGMDLIGLYSGGRAMDAGPAALAEATMDGFRVAPVGLDESMLVPLVRALPDEIRIEIEKALQRDGFYDGQPTGNFGPDVRKALVAWVDAKGPLPDEGGAAASPAPSAPTTAGLSPELVARVRDRVFTAATGQVDSDEERAALVAQFNALARYGDMPSRWVLVRNYHQAQVIRDGVTPAEITRYGLDILVTNPEGVEKADFEFIFDLTAMMEDGTVDAFGEAMVNAVRDDPRLQDPLTLGSIMQQLVFAPGACDAILTASGAVGIADIGDDGCGESAKQALIAFAKVMGPAGVEEKARADAVAELARLDAEAH